VSRSLLPAAGRLLLASIVAALLAGCGGDDDDPVATATPPGPTATPAIPPLEGEIVVFAAASLIDAFTEAGTAFEKANPRTSVTFNFAASSALATQINEGAPADVFASADSSQMDVVTDAGNASEPRQFVTNRPVVVVPEGSDRVKVFEELARPGLKLVLAGPDVPIGRYSRDILARASAATGGVSPTFSKDVLANLRSNEANVRAVLTKVQLGEADAGIVYSTDIRAAAGEVVAIDIPEQYNVAAGYPIAVVSESKEKDVAEAFIAFILSAEGQGIMQRFGFGAP
jgi:molybdate transport system substrate-binding protein